MDPFLTTPRPDLRGRKILDAAHHLAATEALGPDDRLLTVRLYGRWITTERHTNGTTRFHVFASLARPLGNPTHLYVRIDPADDTRVICSTTPPGMKVYAWDPNETRATRFSCAPLKDHLHRIGFDMTEKHFFRAEVFGTRLIIDTSRSFDKRHAIIHEKEHPECRGTRRHTAPKPSSPRAS